MCELLFNGGENRGISMVNLSRILREKRAALADDTPIDRYIYLYVGIYVYINEER